MNKVSITGTIPPPKNYEAGNIFSNKENDELYILAEVDGNFTAICLNDGMTWSSLTDIEDAVRGLTFVSAQATIQVTP